MWNSMFKPGLVDNLLLHCPCVIKKIEVFTVAQTSVICYIKDDEASVVREISYALTG